MPEEAVETQELKDQIEEMNEHAHAAHGGHGAARPTGWLTWLSLSTAIVAVLAAVASLESGSFANEAIVQKNDAILHQSKADDAWAYYHAKGLEAVLYETQAEATARPDLATRWHASAQHETEQRAEIRKDAEREAGTVLERDEQSERSFHRHHQFAKSVTIFQVAIALSAIAALTRRKPMWWVSLAMGAGGVALFVLGFLPS